jgi:hypothetical protein
VSVVRKALCVLVAGMTLFAVGALFHLVVPLVAPGIPPQFSNAALFRPWPGWTSTYMFLHPFGFAPVFTSVFLLLRSSGGISSDWQGGLLYGFGVFLVGSLPVYMLVFASFQVSIEVIISWILQSAIQYILAGVAIGWMAGPAAPCSAEGGAQNDLRPEV